MKGYRLWKCIKDVGIDKIRVGEYYNVKIEANDNCVIIYNVTNTTFEKLYCTYAYLIENFRKK